MSFTQDFDARFSLAFYEVHYWPNIRRVLVIHKPTHEVEPMLTDVRITHECDDSTVFILALALADAGVPSGGVFRHDADGTVWRITESQRAVKA